MSGSPQTWDFTSAQHNHAAQADSYDGVGPITGADLLANDPGSAIFMGLYDSTTGKFLGGADGATPQPTDVDLSPLLNTTDSVFEVIRMANGTFSLATVAHYGTAFVDDFTTGFGVNGSQIPLGFHQFTGTAGVWQLLPDSARVEVVGLGYIHFTNDLNGANDHNWVDTQATPGGIDIKTSVATNIAADHDVLSITLTPEKVPNGLKTNPDGKLDLTFNGNLVHEFTLADFETTPGDINAVQYNTPHEFEYTVPDNGSGVGIIGIHDVTATASRVGFAINQVALISHIT
jgi:hypothetical protein